jgi:hypothetical protein
MQYQRLDLIGPGVGLAVGLHFLPLGRLFRMRPYYVAGGLEATASFLVLLPSQQALTASTRLVLLGVVNALTMWATALYAIRNCDTLAQRWVDDATSP